MSGAEVGWRGDWRVEAMRDRGRLAPGRRVELPQDVRDVDAGGLDADDKCLRDLPVRVATGDKANTSASRDLAEVLLQPPAVDPVTPPAARDQDAPLGKQFELTEQGPGAAPCRNVVGFPSESLASTRDAPAATSASAWRERQ